MDPIIAGTADFGVGMGTVVSFASVALVDGHLRNNEADGVGIFVYAPSTNYVQAIKSHFKVQDGAGLFCSWNGTGGVRFLIEYRGTETLFKLWATGTTIGTKLTHQSMPFFAEIAMPDGMSRGTEYQFFLTTADGGWRVSYQNAAGAYVPLLDLPYFSPAGTQAAINGTPSDDLRDAGAVYGGAYAVKNGVTFRTLTVYHTGYQLNPYVGTKVLFHDQFTGAAANYNPANATPVPAGSTQYMNLPAVLPGSTTVRDGSGQLSTTAGTPEQIIGNFTGKGPSLTDFPCTRISFRYVSGEFVLALILNATSKNIYFNSDIAAPGTFKAVSIETGGP